MQSVPIIITLHRKPDEKKDRKIGKTIWINALYITEIIVIGGTTRVLLSQLVINEGVIGYEDVIEDPQTIIDKIAERVNGFNS